MKVLVTGSGGQLGQTLLANSPAELHLVGVDQPDADLTDKDQVSELVREQNPNVIVNTAAYTAVDLAESEEGLAASVNVDGVVNVAMAAQETGARVIHLSTDFVFDGKASIPYAPDAAAHPKSVYGRTKYAGEERVREIMPGNLVIVRTAWLYSAVGHNFVNSMLRLMAERDEISVVNDQVGSPTWAGSLAGAIFAFIARPEVSGTYHWTDSGQASWYEFACAIQEEAFELGQIEKMIGIRPIPSAEYPAAAPRPAYSVLDCTESEQILDLKAAPWRENLRAMLLERVPQ
jgi:dTDP-4-dehydrorhamnose reductase